ncbi:MAG: ester cyclase [Deltaproteobacteria bacterium]|nr:ester cyclase [Deltaproteobacteria bacterium]
MGTTTRLLHNWFDQVWNQGRYEAIDQLMHPNSRFHGLGPEPLSRDDFKAFHQAFNGAFSDVQITVERCTEEGESVAAWCSCTLTHRATGKPCHFSGAVMGEIRDGKLGDGWNSFDFLGLLTQLGVVGEGVMGEALGVG